MRAMILATILVAAAGAASAAGDPAKGEKVFRKCKACHAIVDGDNVIQKGGKTGPNLFGLIGRTAGTHPDFTKYSAAMKEAGEAGLVWSEETFVEYAADPSAFLKAFLDDSGAKSKMVLKLKKGAEDAWAYFESVMPPATN